jgi:uncharacterized repeat protein (TIGR03803 family)
MKQPIIYFFLFFLAIPSTIEAQNPTLWGMTSEGGANDSGTIFSYNVGSGVCTLRHSFSGGPSDGVGPYGSLIQADDGLLYGMTDAGGVNNRGIIFSYNISTGELNDVHDFDNGVFGQYPSGALLQARNRMIYGMTNEGGLNNNAGVIFSYSILTNEYTVLHNFGAGNDGANPFGSLIQVNDSLLLGTCNSSGQFNFGTIFSYNMSSGTETTLYSFIGNGNGGYEPYGSLLQANNGLLYGTTDGGSAYYYGNIFSFNLDSDTETSIHSFNDSADGSFPFGSLIQINDSLLYGMTAESSGGAGAIFSCNIFTNAETILHNFNVPIEGGTPSGPLFRANNGLLYGMTIESVGGNNDFGTIFSYNISTNTETVIHNFSGGDGNVPTGGMIEIDDTLSAINLLSPNNIQLSIFPNPSTGVFNIQLPDIENNYQARVFNLFGEEVLQTSMHSGQNVLDLSYLSVGTYFICTQTPEATIKGKVVIMK